MDEPRKRILREIKSRDLELKALSLAMGRNAAYLQQFLHRGTPAVLKEQDREKLAELLGITEVDLGGPIRDNVFPISATACVIHEYDVRQVVGGTDLFTPENRLRPWPFNAGYLRDAGISAEPDRMTIIEVRGDGMSPTLGSGDRVMVDTYDKAVSQPGVFAIDDGSGLSIKRVEKVPGKASLLLIPDNDRHSTHEVGEGVVTIIGRIIWAARRM